MELALVHFQKYRLLRDTSINGTSLSIFRLESPLYICYSFQTVDKLAPYIEEVYPGFVLATGGCGYAAKGSDEIGRIAAKLCTKGQLISKCPFVIFKLTKKPTTFCKDICSSF